MQKAANTSRFLMGFSLDGQFADSESSVTCDHAFRGVALGGLTASTHQLFSELADRFVRLAENAYSFRNLKRLEGASRVLMVSPLARARQIGLFYQGLVLKRTGQIDQAQELFESIADSGPLAYRARALQALGALHFDIGQPSEALRFHIEAGRLTLDNHDPLVALLIQLEVSHIRAAVGDHHRALASLERLASLVRFVSKEHPSYYYFYHNALAVEFADLGRFLEAETACSIAVSSPYAYAYPEWSATRDEIAAKRTTLSPSIAAIRRAAQAKPATQAEPRRTPKPSTFVTSGRANTCDFFQRSTIEFSANRLIVLTAISILDRVLACIGPRAPPPLSGHTNN